MPGTLTHTRLYQDMVGTHENPMGVNLNDFLRILGIYPSVLTHNVNGILNDFSREESMDGLLWLPRGMHHHSIADYVVDKTPKFKKAFEAANQCPEGLIIMKRPEHVSQQKWEEVKDDWYRHKLADLALCYGVWKMDRDLPGVITDWKYSTSTDEIAEGLYKIFGNLEFPQKMETPEEEKQRVKKMVNENYEKGIYDGDIIKSFMEERSEEFERILAQADLGTEIKMRKYLDPVSREAESFFKRYAASL